MPVEDDYKKFNGVNPENPDYYPSSLSGVGLMCTGVEKAFEPGDADKLKQRCAEIISCGPTRKSRVNNLFSKTEERREFIDKYSMGTVINRIKYEQRKGKEKLMGYNYQSCV